MRNEANSLFITITRTIVAQYILNLYKDQNKNTTGFLGDPKGGNGSF